MHQFFLYFCCFLSLASLQHKQGGEKIKVEITRQTTLEELQQIQQYLKENGIDLSIEKSTYNAINQLTAIRIKVDFGGGNVKKYGAKNFKKFTIVRDLSEDAERPFYIL
ncbi:MAG: hypothetical protein R3E32_28390 [Chitinophagales bacterium]